MTGWIKLHRSTLKWEWYDDLPTFRLFTHLLLSVNYEQKQWRGITVEPGQIITGRKALSAATKLSEMQIRGALEKLKKTKEITIKSYSKFSVITVNGWKEYQQSNQQNDHQTTNNQPTNSHQTTTTKEGEEIKERKKVKKKRVFNPPTLDDVISYFIEKGYTREAAKKAFSYYDVEGWKDSRGKQVLSWKQKMISVWFKPENKQKKTNIRPLDRNEAADIMRQAGINTERYAV